LPCFIQYEVTIENKGKGEIERYAGKILLSLP